jgi:hypothetical protein
MAPPLTVQLTSVSVVFCTVAVNCWVPPVSMLVALGLILTVTTGGGVLVVGAPELVLVELVAGLGEDDPDPQAQKKSVNKTAKEQGTLPFKLTNADKSSKAQGWTCEQDEDDHKPRGGRWSRLEIWPRRDRCRYFGQSCSPEGADSIIQLTTLLSSSTRTPVILRHSVSRDVRYRQEVAKNSVIPVNGDLRTLRWFFPFLN